MKKLISIALMLALCLTLFAGCDITSLFTPDPSEGLLAAKDYLDTFMSEQTTTTSLDFEVMPVVANEHGSFPIEWTSDNANVTFVKNEESGLLTVVLPGCAAEVVTFTLTATLSEDSGAKVTSTFTFTIPAANYVTAPEVGKAYKLGLFYTNDAENPVAYYFNGQVASTYYGGTTVAFASGVDVYLEEAEGGYYMYFMKGETKTYIYIAASGDHRNFKFNGTTASCVFAFDAKKGTFYTTVTVGETQEICYMGNYGTYNSFSAFNESNLSADTYLAHLYDKDVNPDFNANDPADGTTLTVTEANTLGKSKPSGVYSTNKYNVTGTVSKIDGKKLYIKDADGNELYIYGFEAAEGVTLKVADTVTVNGVVGCYGGKAQMKDVTITAHTAHTCEYSDPTCTEAATCIHCGATTGEALGHTDADKDHTCDIESCGATNVGPHTDGDDEDTLCDYGCGIEITPSAAPVTATESKDIIADKGTLATDSLSITWTATNFTFTANKNTSNTAINTGNYDHFRVYAGNIVTIAGVNNAKISKIVITATGSSYVDDFKNNSVTGLPAGVTATCEGTTITLTLAEAVDSISFTSVKQLRLNKVEVTYVK